MPCCWDQWSVSVSGPTIQPWPVTVVPLQRAAQRRTLSGCYCTTWPLHYRDKRAGWRVRKRDSLSCHHKYLATSRGQLPITIVDSSGFHRYRHSVIRSHNRTPVNMQHHLTTSRVTKLGNLNARSIGNKHTQIVDEITSESYNLFAIVETWHESAYCPSIIACTSSGYRCIERARPRSTKAETTSSVNHGRCVLVL